MGHSFEVSLLRLEERRATGGRCREQTRCFWWQSETDLSDL